MRKLCKPLTHISLLLVACVVSQAAAQRPSLTIPRVSEPPVLERYLDGKTIPPGFKVTGFVQREPGDGVPSTAESEAYVSYDARNFYVVFICRDDPRKVRANLSKRESIEGDDRVGVVLDPYNDGRRAYLLVANPLGIQMDGIVSDGQDDDYSYDALWKSEGRLTDFGYAVLFSIPFKSLRFSNATVQTWGIAFARAVMRNNETSFWPYITRRIAGFGQQMATMDGLQGISPGRNLQAIPYGNFATARILDDAGTRRVENSTRVGVDAKAVIKDALTIDLTVNPDFSQVESDEPQVTVNQRFEVFFPEKRPFFIENAGFFETPQNLFFSRRVADPGVGARFTGKARGWAIAGLVVNDEQAGRAVAEEDPRAGKSALVNVLRLQREFGDQSHVGAIFTDREFGASANRVYGADARWKLNDNWSLTGQWVGSQTIDTARAGRNGTSWSAEINRDGRNFEYSGDFTSISPDFRAELGYVPRVDMRELRQDFGYTWHPEKSRVLAFGANIEGNALWDFGGKLQNWSVESGLEMSLAGQTEVGLRHSEDFERYEGLQFRRHDTFAYASTEWLSWLGGGLHYSRGSGINYYPAAGLAPFLANETSAEASLTFKPLAKLRVDQSYIHSKLSTRNGVALPSGTPTGEIFSDNILRTRVNYQFTRELSARVILDYEAVSPNPALVDLEHERTFNADVLLTYLVNPWTAVYLGYTDGYENRPLGAAMQRPPSADTPLTSVGRQVFAKFSYLFKY